MKSKKDLRDFFGVLSGESGERFEKAIRDARKSRNEAHRKRLEKILKELNY